MKNRKETLLKYSKEHNIDFNIVLKYYFFENFLKRASLSLWNKNLILKGGFLLSILTGVKERTTKDMDFSIIDCNLDIEIINKIIDDISNIELNDDTSFELTSVNIIMEDKDYYGIRAYLDCVAFGIKDNIHIDFATGDKIFPSASFLNIKSFLANSSFNIYAYSLESIISEKLETILSKLENNSRMKDYFDIYFISRFFNNNIRRDKLKKAIRVTFKYRKYNDNPFDSLNIIKNSNVLKTYWNAYSRKNNISVDYMDVINEVEKYIKYIKVYLKRASLDLSFV